MPVVEAQNVFSREQAALAGARELAAGMGAQLVDPALIVPFQVLTALVGEQRENQAAVLVALRIGRLRELGAPAILEALDVLRLENDLVVATACRALRAI